MSTKTMTVAEAAAEAKMKDSSGVAEQLTSKISTYTAGVANVDNREFIEQAPEAIRQYIPLVQAWEKQFLTGAVLSAGMANVSALAADKGLAAAEVSIPMGSNTLTVKTLRESEQRSGIEKDAPMKTVYGVTKVAYEVDAAATSRGEVKRIRGVIGQYATALLGN